MRILLFVLLLTFIGCGSKTERVDGSPGADGTSCYSETRSDVNYVVCGESEFKVEDGEDGSFEGYLELVEICPEKSGNHIETLLYLDGDYLAFLSDPNYKKQRLVKLKEGTLFQTTDGRVVKFTINNGSIIYSTNGCNDYTPVQ